MDGVGQRLVVSQPHVQGMAPDLAMMDRALRENGYRRLALPALGYYHSYSYIDGTIGLFDAHPANFVLSGGELVPIDVIIVEFSEADAAWLRSQAL